MRCATIILLSLLGLACATQPAPQPLLSLSRQDCASVPAMSSAVQPDWTKKNEAVVDFNATSPCLSDTVSARPFAVVALPAAAENYSILVGSNVMNNIMLPLKVEFLDEAGVPTRAIEGSKFTFRSNQLAVQVRGHAGEHFVLITSDPELVGQTMKQVRMRVANSGVALPGGYVPILTGVDQAMNLTFAHNGRVFVMIEPLTPAK